MARISITAAIRIWCHRRRLISRHFHRQRTNEMVAYSSRDTQHTRLGDKFLPYPYIRPYKRELLFSFHFSALSPSRGYQYTSSSSSCPLIIGRRRSDRNSIGCLRKRERKKMSGPLLCVCVGGRSGRERETGRESSHIQSTRRGTWVLNWYDMMQLLSFSIIFQHTHSPSFFFFPPLPADCRPAAPSLPCVCHPSLYTVVVVVALYPTNTTNKEKIERHSAEKRDGIGLNFHVAQASCTSLRFFQIIISHTHTQKKGTKKRRK